MTVTEQDIQTIKQIIEPLYGERAWGVSRIFGSYIHCHFGKPTPGTEFVNEVSLHGKWWLCVHSCGWRLQAGSEVLTSSEDRHEYMDPALERLNGKFITSIEIERPSMLTTVTFTEDLFLRLFPIRAEREYDEDFWTLYTPDRDALIIGPGTQWKYRRSGVQYSRKIRDRKQED